jgi:hypothetical protein
MIKSDTITNLAGALVKAQSEMGNASKGAANPFFKSKYADLNAIREACLPVLSKHGLSVLQPTVFIDGRKFVETLVMHESGEFIGGHTEILSVKELDAQAQGSGVSYARRYGLQSLLCIGAEDDDGEGAIGRSKSYSKPTTATVTTSSTIDTSAVKTTKPGGFGVKKNDSYEKEEAKQLEKIAQKALELPNNDGWE